MAVKKDSRIYATGRRKTSVARIFLNPKGKGVFTVNDKDHTVYFPEFFRSQITEVFQITDTQNQFDIYCTVKGGGVNGQAEAIRHGLARALNELDRDKYRPILKAKGFLTRDDRMVERKKYGLRKARKREQYSKR
ncbi:MAG: 30S ribosomal protein S9 [Brevinemataceae bacterium]